MGHDIQTHGIVHEIFDMITWDDAGLVTVIAQEAETGEVLMLAYANREALALTLSTGVATYYSRSRKALWVKGETSGFTQKIIELRTDCDGDAILYSVCAPGPACHQMRRSCFSHRIDRDGSVHTDKPVMDTSAE